MKVKVTELGAEKALIVGKRYEAGAEVLVPDILGRLLVDRGVGEEVRPPSVSPGGGRKAATMKATTMEKAVKADEEKAVK